MALSPARCLIFGALCLLAASAPGGGQQEAFRRAGWLADLKVVRSAFATKYRDLEWQVFERGVNLNNLFDAARTGIERANSAHEAERVFDQLAHQSGNRQLSHRNP
jgi:hypothetical protein